MKFRLKPTRAHTGIGKNTDKTTKNYLCFPYLYILEIGVVGCNFDTKCFVTSPVASQIFAQRGHLIAQRIGFLCFTQLFVFGAGGLERPDLVADDVPHLRFS